MTERPIELRKRLIEEAGLSALPEALKASLLEACYAELEQRVGQRLAHRMSEQQLTDFESFIDRQDEAGALRWLNREFPEYQEVVRAEMETIRQDLLSRSEDILALVDVDGEVADP